MLLTYPDGQTLDIEVNDTSYRRREIMGDDVLMLYFSLPEFVDVPVGAWCEFKAARYFLLKPENFTKQHSRDWRYTLQMDSASSLMKHVKCKFFTLDDGAPDSPFELKFSLTETPARFARLLADNMNLADPDGGWTAGECIDGVPATVDFNHDYCYGVLAKVAEAFNTEWEVDGKTICFRRVEREKNSPVPLAYGYNRGLKPGVGRNNYDNSKVINRLFIEGSDRNIDRSKYGATTLHMPVGRTIVYEGISYRTDPTGTYIERDGRTGRIVEDSLDLTKVYPSHTGTVSRAVPANPEKGLYDIIDDSIPPTLDYSQCIIAGETMTVVFQTGQLAGKEFEAGYNHSERRFELVPVTENGVVYPAGNIVPEKGDTYAVFHVMLPETYIDEAEERMLAEAVKYLWENEQPKYTFTGTLDELYASRNWGALAGRLDCGYFVAFSDDQFLAEPVPIRITAVKEYVNRPRQPEITLSNEVNGKTLSSTLAQIPAQEQATDRKQADVMRYARRRWKDTEELIAAMYDPSGHFQEDLISSLVLEAMTLRLGDPSLQFVFLATDWKTVVPLTVKFDPDTKRVTVDGVQRMQHMTMGIDSIRPAHPAGEYLFWQLDAFRSDALTEEPDTPYYLYAQCSKSHATVSGRKQGTGRFWLSAEKLELEDARHPGMYNLWVGFLNSEYDGDRSFRTVYGYTEVLPGQVTTDKIVSSDGRTYFDLLQGIIAGNIKFISPDGSLKDVQTGIDDTVNAVEIGARNWIAKKYLLDWNKTQEGTTELGSDEDGDYLAVNQQLLYQYIGNMSNYSDIFQGKIKYKPDTQYAFKVRWKLAGVLLYSGLNFRFYYDDGEYDTIFVKINDTTIRETSIVTRLGKSLAKIACSYGSNEYRTLIYDIQLTEGNKQVAGYITAPEDIEAGIMNEVNMGNGGVALLKNGRGEYGNNTYFTACEYRGEQYNGSTGMFVLNETGSSPSFGEQIIPVDTSKAYRIGCDVKTKNAKHHLFFFHAAYDIDKNIITSKNVMFIAGTTTSLAQPLNNGDTAVHVDSLAGWDVTTGATYRKGFTLWNYANSKGYVYPAETYSRNNYQGLYTDNAAVDKATNTITLDKPWSGGHVPAGTELSQCSDAATYQYFIDGVQPAEWTHHEILVKGENGNSMANTRFLPGCAYIGLGWMANYNRSTEEDETYVANMFINEDIATREDVTNAVDEGIANMEIGGENMITETNSDKISLQTAMAPSKPSATLATGLPAGKYVFSFSDFSRSATGVGMLPPSVWLSLNGTNVCYLDEDRKEYMFNVPNDGSTLTLEMSTIKPYGFVTITHAMLQRGTKPTSYQQAVQYLTDAIKKGSTDILGGLLLTNLLAVKNTAGSIIGGVSGMSDNVAFWSGGSYEQAVQQATGGSGNLPVLITKSPTGIGTKFGIFKIIPNGIQVDAIDGSSKIIVTNDTVEKAAPVQQTISVNFANAGRYFREQSGSGTIDILDDTIEGTGKDMICKVFEMPLGKMNGKYTIPSTRITVSLSAHAECKYPNSNRAWSYSNIGIRAFYLYLYNGDELVYKENLGCAVNALAALSSSSSSVTTPQTATLTVSGEYDFGDEGNCRLVIGAQVDTTPSLQTKNKIVVYDSIPVIGQTSIGRDYASASITASGTLKLVGMGMYTVLGKDGIAVIANSESSFRVYNNSEKSELNVQLKGLPTDNYLLTSGQLWRDGDTIKIMS